MRWLVGWSSAAVGAGAAGIAGAAGSAGATGSAGVTGYDGETVQPVGAQPLWGDPDPLWAVGDWRPDEVRVVTADPQTRIAVLGICGASDEQLRVALFAARGGALRHLTAWSGSYTAVVQVGRRITVCGDLAGARPVFHTPWAGGTAYATAALPLADLVEANLDFGHLAALLATPDVPAALDDSTPYDGVKRVPPGHALILRAGAREIAGYEPVASLAVAAPSADPDRAVDGVRDALVEAVRTRLAAPRHVPGDGIDPGPVPGMGPAERRAARGMPVPGIGADLSGGPASGTLALLAAGLPGMPGTVLGHGTGAGERLLAVTFNDLAVGGQEPELARAGALAANPRLHHVVVTGGEEMLPYAALDGPLTDEPGSALVAAARHRARLAAGSADHFTGYGARQVLDAHPARLADLLMDRKRRHLVRPVAALAKADGSVLVPARVYAAARRLARTPYRSGLEVLAERLLRRRFDTPGDGAMDASLAALTWAGAGPAARWLTGEALAEVSVRLQTSSQRSGVGPGQRPGDFRARAALARQAAEVRVLEQAAEIRFQRLHTPFLDNQVVRACRALPEALRVRPGARAAILRTVLEGAGVSELPPGWGAPTQALAASAARTGLRVSADSLLGLFDRPLLAEAGLVEARVVRKAVRAAAAGEPLPLDGLADLVSLELWLGRLLARRGTCWTGTPARQRAVPAGIAPQRGALGGAGAVVRRV